MIVDNGREVVIRVRGLAKSFGSYQIWDGLSLDVYRGEILAIVGGSGQGKSVLMKHLMGLLKPDAGQILVDARGVSRLYQHRVRKRDLLLLVAAAVLTLAVLLIVSEPTRLMLRGFLLSFR